MAGCTDVMTPLDRSQKLNLSTLVNLNYTNQDFYSFKTRLIQYIKEKFPEDFNDFVEGSLAVMLIENWAFLADTLSFKMDQIANEIFIDTVTEIDNAFRLSKLVGFQPQPPIAARAMFSATIQSVLTTDLNLGNAIPIDLSATDGTINYELFPADALNNPILEGDVIITSGSVTNTTVVGLEGSTQIDDVVADGGSNQNYLLQQSPVLYDSIRVDVDGQRWNQVEYFTDGNPRNEYRVEFDSSYNAYIIFGDGRAGRAPTSGSSIRATYRTGGGTRGNVVAGAFNVQRGFNVAGFDFQIPVTFRNYTKGEFGYVGDGVEDIRRKLPEYIKTQDRAVTAEDYQILSGQFSSPYNGQTGKSVAALRNYGCAGNVIDIYTLVKDGADGLDTPSDEFKIELSNYLDAKKMMTDNVCIRDGVILLVDTSIDVVLDKFYKKFRDEINTKINNKVAEFFSLNNWDFGKTLKDSELIKYLTTLTEVVDVTVNFETTDPDNSGSVVVAKYYEIIRNDQTTINLVFA